jgi:hypothetical protein
MLWDRVMKEKYIVSEPRSGEKTGTQSAAMDSVSSATWAIFLAGQCHD